MNLETVCMGFQVDGMVNNCYSIKESNKWSIYEPLDYLEKLKDKTVSHGICPRCYEITKYLMGEGK